MSGLTPRGQAPFGLILAGGLARRMGGGDKGLMALRGETILSRVIRTVAPQCAALSLSTRGDPQRWNAYGLPVIVDHRKRSEGPLAGILAGLTALERRGCEHDTLLSVPGDTPFLPRDLVTRLIGACRLADKPVACAASGGREHPAIALWPVSLRLTLADGFERRGVRSVRAFQAEVGVAVASWEATDLDPFFNINIPEDLAEAERLLTRPSGS